MEKNPVFAKMNKHGAGKSSTGRMEKDIDDLVHEGAHGEALDRYEEDDPDDRVHRVKRTPSSPMNTLDTGMEDPDDLVHGFNEDDEG